MLKKIFLMLLILLSMAAADLKLQVREANGRSVFERNSVYNVYLQVVPDSTTVIGAIGEIYLEYDHSVFTDLTSFTTDFQALPSSIWESEKVSFNHKYATSPNYVCIEYAKTANNGPYWTIGSQQNIYLLSFAVRPNAPTGNTSIRFIYNSDNSRTKMISSQGSTIPLTINNLALVIDLDRTPPTTRINPAGGLYNYAPQIRLSPDEDGIEHYMVIGGSNVWETQTVSKNAWTGIISIPGTANQVRYSTVQYYGEDFALDKAHNLESQKSAQYIVDMEKPVISNILVPGQIVPIGSIAEISFMLSDLVGIGNRNVNIGGRPAYYVSGSGSGQYVYRRLIDGTENSSGEVYLTVYDTAGNVATDNSKTVPLDFGGPYFYNITTDPPTPQISQEVIISFAASEQLLNNPIVNIGRSPAVFVNKDNLNYQYRYTVTGNGWYIPLRFISDGLEPFTERNLPRRFSNSRPRNTSIYFRIGDNLNQVNTRDMQVVVNGQQIYGSGAFINGYHGRIVELDHKQNVICIPPLDFLSLNQVTVDIKVADWNANTLNEVYNFQTSALYDYQLPEIQEAFPPEGTVTAGVNTPIYFELNDNSGCGLAIDRINLTFNEYKRQYQGAAKIAAFEIVPIPAIINGVFQTGFSGAIIPDEDGNLSITIIPADNLPAGITINCLVGFEDLARVPNVGTVSWNFNTQAVAAGETVEGRYPLAWPTIYDPTNPQKILQQLTFNLKDNGETILRIYDLSGDMIWEHKYTAEAGYQSIPWDGRDARGKLVGNGPYIWYIIKGTNKHVVGRGVSIIMK